MDRVDNVRSIHASARSPVPFGDRGGKQSRWAMHLALLGRDGKHSFMRQHARIPMRLIGRGDVVERSLRSLLPFIVEQSLVVAFTHTLLSLWPFS